MLEKLWHWVWVWEFQKSLLLLCFNYFNLFTSQILPHLTESLPHPTSPLRRWDIPFGYPSNFVNQVSARLGLSSSTEARQGSYHRHIHRHHSQATALGKPLLQWLDGPHGDSAACLLHMCWGSRSSPCIYLFFLVGR